MYQVICVKTSSGVVKSAITGELLDFTIPSPKKGYIVTVTNFEYMPDGVPCYQFKEYDQRHWFEAENYRPLDDSGCSDVVEKLERQIKEDELILF